MSPLSNEDRRELLRRARHVIVEAVGRGRIPEHSPLQGELAKFAGAFVTLRLHERLMGCVGHIEADEPLGDVVVRCAIASALHDSRFRPVSLEDVPRLTIEISVLAPPERIAPESIEVGRHGLIVERGGVRGLLLPQVAAERNWPRERFLEETCLKAGIPADAWKDSQTHIYAFSAEAFSEDEEPSAGHLPATS
jgi:AmmeMemoRadiSam system protein A